MSKRLPRLRVAEKHGMRRFLYPLRASIQIPSDYPIDDLCLRTDKGELVPSYLVEDVPGQGLSHLEFAVSLSPFETIDLELAFGRPMPVPDAIEHTKLAGGRLETKQQRLSIVLNGQGSVSRVHYDSVDHLRGPFEARYNGVLLSNTPVNHFGFRSSEIHAESRSHVKVGSSDGTLNASMSACKSWVTQELVVSDSTPETGKLALNDGDSIEFILPLVVKSPVLLCDFGLGGGIYTKFNTETTSEIVVEVDAKLNWFLRNGDRVDYAGSLTRRLNEDYAGYHGLDELWFHVVDQGVAIAVAITKAPVETKAYQIRITNEGHIIISFVAAEVGSLVTSYAVCYHFLNDVPAIAAATCPQSILLPPVVEVFD